MVICVLSWCDVRCILYLILYSSPLLIYSLFCSLLLFSIFCSPLLFYTLPSSFLLLLWSISLFFSSFHPNPLIQSIRVGTCVTLFIFLYNIPRQSSSDLSPLLLSFPYSNPFIQSIRVGIWISLFIFNQYLSPGFLTPHVLSEWMVEVCRF